MKHYILYIAAGMMALACTKSAIDPLSADYPKPTTYSLTQFNPGEPEG